MYTIQVREGKRRKKREGEDVGFRYQGKWENRNKGKDKRLGHKGKHN